MPSRHDLPNYLPSPARRAPTQEFDYQELVADPKFHAVIDEHKKNGTFAGLDEGTSEYSLRLREIAVAFVGVVNEKRATLFRNRGILNGRRGAFREAISCYNRALELSNNSPSRHVTLANRSAAYIKSQKFAEALADAQEARLLCPQYSIAHSLMGYCHSRLGMAKKAVVNYNVALQLNPADVSSQGLLAEVKKSLIRAGETAATIEALEAPFVATREQDVAAIQAVTTAALQVPVMHKRYFDGAERAGSIQEMVKKAGMPINAGCESQERELVGPNSSDMPSPTKDDPEKQKRPLSRKLSSGSMQAFASTLTKIPGKLKHALGKKNRRSSSSKGQHLGRDFPGLYQNVVDDATGVPAPTTCTCGAAGAPAPATCTCAGSALAVPGMSAGDVPRGESNPLFCADRHRQSTCANTALASRDMSSVGGTGVGVGGGGTSAGRVFSSTEPSAGGPVGQNSGSGNGGGPAVPSRYVQQQRRQQLKRPQKQGLPPETPPRTRLAEHATEQRPGAHTAVARQKDRFRRKSKDRQEREGHPCSSADAAPEHNSGGGATASLTPPSAPEDGSAKPPWCPPAPRLGLVQKKTLDGPQATPRRDPQQQAPTAQTIVQRGSGSSWVPEKSGYASSESDASEGSSSLLRSRAVAVEATASGGEDRVPSILPNATTERDRTLANHAVTEAAAAGRQPAVARSSEKAGWTASGSIFDGGESRSMARESGGHRSRLDASATTEVLMRDEEGTKANGALRILLDGDSDCGSVYESVKGRGGENAIVEGEKALAATTQIETSRMELPQADAQAVNGKCFTQSLGGGANAYDRRPAGKESISAHRITQSLGGADGEGSARGHSRAAVGNMISTMFADAAEPEGSARRSQSVSVRSKIEMFERTARSSSLGGEEAKPKITVERTAQPRKISRSLSEKIRAHESAISAAKTSKGLPGLSPAFQPDRLRRSKSYQHSTR